MRSIKAMAVAATIAAMAATPAMASGNAVKTGALLGGGSAAAWISNGVSHSVHPFMATTGGKFAAVVGGAAAGAAVIWVGYHLVKGLHGAAREAAGLDS